MYSIFLLTKSWVQTASWHTEVNFLHGVHAAFFFSWKPKVLVKFIPKIHSSPAVGHISESTQLLTKQCDSICTQRLTHNVSSLKFGACKNTLDGKQMQWHAHIGDHMGSPTHWYDRKCSSPGFQLVKVIANEKGSWNRSGVFLFFFSSVSYFTVYLTAWQFDVMFF